MFLEISGRVEFDMDKKILQDIGLTPKEVDVYLTLLISGESSITEVMSKAHVSRKSIYEILQKLLDKGLVSYVVKDNKKRFVAVNPERLVDIIKEKERNLQNLLPELLKKYKENKKEVNIQVFTGTEGMKTVSNNILKLGKTFYVLANEGKIFAFLKYYMPQFLRQKEKMKIYSKIIYSESFRKKNMQVPLSEARYVSDKFSSPISLAIYDDNVNILIFSENPIAIHIQSKEISKSFMNYFNLMWSIGKK